MKYLRLVCILTISLMLFECGKDKSSGPSIPDPIASFTESGETVSPATLSFQNTSQNADAYVWRFGDGDSTTITNPTHTYDVYGTYMVSLIAQNTSTGKFDTEIKQIPITPGSVFIEAIRVDQVPFTDEYGAGWDLLSGPDLDLYFVNSGGIVFYFNYYYLDVAPSDLPLTWDVIPEFRIPSWSTVYGIELWDYDDIGSDYMGTTNGFSINHVISSAGYASTVSLQNNSGTIRAVIMLRWQ